MSVGNLGDLPPSRAEIETDQLLLDYLAQRFLAREPSDLGFEAFLRFAKEHLRTTRPSAAYCFQANVQVQLSDGSRLWLAPTNSNDGDMQTLTTEQRSGLSADVTDQGAIPVTRARR